MRRKEVLRVGTAEGYGRFKVALTVLQHFIINPANAAGNSSNFKFFEDISLRKAAAGQG
jgi:hypothetical protein